MDWVIEDLTMEDANACIDEIVAIYNEYGLVVLPGFLTNDPDFLKFLDDVRSVLRELFDRHDLSYPESDDLGDYIAALSHVAPLDGRIVADLGTQPNKFVSANQVKYSPFVCMMMQRIFGPDSIVASPHAGDTLHLFMPGEQFRKYSLPIHQDYQYLLQSPRQCTLYLGMSAPKPKCGALEYWPGSQKLGILRSTKNEHGSFAVVDEAKIRAEYPTETYFWETGDVAFFDSLMCHRSIPNESADAGRVIQIFRFSDLNDDQAAAYDWRSTVYPRRSVGFEVEHRELYQEPL